MLQNSVLRTILIGLGNGQKLINESKNEDDVTHSSPCLQTEVDVIVRGFLEFNQQAIVEVLARTYSEEAVEIIIEGANRLELPNGEPSPADESILVEVYEKLNALHQEDRLSWRP